jgi:hypothetical protein
VPAGTQRGNHADCPAQTKLIGGGDRVAGGTTTTVNSSYPIAGSPDEWEAFVNNTGTSATSFDVYAICATVSP